MLLFFGLIHQGADPGRGKNRPRDPLLQRTSLDRKATATNRMHNSDLEAFERSVVIFWFNSEVKVLTRF